jgi:hypothetical protein
MFRGGAAELKACERDPAALIFHLPKGKNALVTQAMPVNPIRLLCQDQSIQKISRSSWQE